MSLCLFVPNNEKVSLLESFGFHRVIVQDLMKDSYDPSKMLMGSGTDMLEDELDMAYKLVIQYTRH